MAKLVIISPNNDLFFEYAPQLLKLTNGMEHGTLFGDTLHMYETVTGDLPAWVKLDAWDTCQYDKWFTESKADYSQAVLAIMTKSIDIVSWGVWLPNKHPYIGFMWDWESPRRAEPGRGHIQVYTAFNQRNRGYGTAIVSALSEVKPNAIIPHAVSGKVRVRLKRPLVAA